MTRRRDSQTGIQARSQRGAFGSSWWARRWASVLESFHMGARLGRGRRYARQGHVLSIEVEKGRVRARVQGSRRRPYRVEMQVRTYSTSQLAQLSRHLRRWPVLAAKLLAGDMPPEIEEVFGQVNVPLFPERWADLATSCSCPDWANPCKHVAAVYYLLGEEFDRDPFLILRMRGLGREELVELLEGGQSETAAGSKTGARAKTETETTAAAGMPLDPDPLRFWQGDAGAEKGNEHPSDFELTEPAVHAALVRQLGDPPFWHGSRSVLDVLEPVYRQASIRAVNLLLHLVGLRLSKSDP